MKLAPVVRFGLVTSTTLQSSMTPAQPSGCAVFQKSAEPANSASAVEIRPCVTLAELLLPRLM